jgi:PAS domain S-box-containing protein
MQPLHILILEDAESDYLLIKRHFRTGGLKVKLHWVQNNVELDAALEQGHWDLVLSDYKIPGLDFSTNLEKMKQRLPHVPVILISGSIGEETAVELFKQGLSDFILKDRLLRLIPAIERCLNEAHEKRKRQEAEARLHAVIDNANSAIWVKDRDGRILEINNYLLNLLQKSREEIIGTTVFDLLPSELAADFDTQERRIIDSGIPEEREESMLLPKGFHTFLSTKFALKDASGMVHSLGAICADITRLKQAENKLKKQEEDYRRLSQEYRTLLDNIPDGIVQLSPDLHVLWVNRAARVMLNLTEEHIYKGLPCHTAFWNQKEPCTPCPIVRCISSNENEIGLFSPNCNDREFEIRAVPMFDQTKGLVSIIEIIRDITAHRKLEEQFRQAQKMESIGTFAGGIAHDFNNILSAILGYGELALEDLEEHHPASKSVRTIIEAGLRASHLTKDLLMFSRKQESIKAPVDLNALITRIEKFIRRIIGEDIQFETHLAKQPLRLLADSHQLDQVLMNFATNARDAMPNGGHFSFTTQLVYIDHESIETHGLARTGDYVKLTVADTGKGMDKETLTKIFDPFFTTKEMGKGTGLGMAVVYGIIMEHAGYISVASEPDHGAVFEVYLPLIQQEQKRFRDQVIQEHPRTGSETILLAEDDENVRELFGYALERAGYTVLTAINGEEAVRVFRSCGRPIDLVMFDLVMPKMNGKLAMEVIQQIQPDIKGLFISGYAPENIQQKDLLDLNKELLLKPASPKELLQTVRRILDA